MSEREKMNPEAVADEAARDQIEKQPAGEPSAPEAMDDRENAPRRPKAMPGSGAKKPGPGGRKRRRRRGLAPAVVAVLLVLALFFGLIVGYTVGRSAVTKELESANLRIAELEEENQAFQGENMNVFEEELTGRNQAALDELSGQQRGDGDEANALVGEDNLLGGEQAASTETAVVVAEFEGGQLLSDEVSRAYEEQMTNYLFAGYSEEEISASLLDEVMRQMVSERVLEAHAREMGLLELTAEDEAQIQAQAEADYQAQLDLYRDVVDTDGLSEEEATGALKAYLQEAEGVTLESVQAEIEKDWWVGKVYDALTADVEVDDDALQEAYDDLLEQQTQSFETYPDDFEFAQMNAETIVYNLPGYRAVRMLVFRMSMEENDTVYSLTNQLQELDAQTQAEAAAQIQAEIDACYADAAQRAERALAELEGGTDFETLLETVGEDDGMRDPQLRSTGYYIKEDSQLWAPALIEAAMALSEPGQISQPVRTEDGVYILQYVGEVAEGAVPLEDVREYLREDVLDALREQAYQQQLDAWVQEANPQYYPERMQ